MESLSRHTEKPVINNQEATESTEDVLIESSESKNRFSAIISVLKEDFKKMGIDLLEVFSQKIGETAGRKLYDYLEVKTEGFDTNIIGIENILELEGSFILAPNHTRPTGNLSLQTGAHPDMILLNRIVAETVGKDPSLVAKGDPGEWGDSSVETKKNILKPIMTGFVRGLGFVPVGLLPGSFNRELVEQISENVNQDRPIIIAPEGRSYDEFAEDHEFKTGVAHFSIKHDIPTIPVFIKDCRDWSEGSENSIIFGEAIYPESGETKVELTDRIKSGVVELSEITK